MCPKPIGLFRRVMGVSGVNPENCMFCGGKAKRILGETAPISGRLSRRSIRERNPSVSMYVSLLIRKMYFPFARWIPRLLPQENPKLALLLKVITSG